MNKIMYCAGSLFFLFGGLVFAQQQDGDRTKKSRFEQMYGEFATPNSYRTASGSPGPDYYQNEADYRMDIVLDDKNAKIHGEQTITYHNNSPQDLEFLWVQLDQNVRSKDSKALLRDDMGVAMAYTTDEFATTFIAPFDGGYHLEWVRDSSGKPLSHTVNFTMMRVDLPQPLKSGESISFSMKWWYNIVDHTLKGDRSGYEYFPKDGNRAYVIAQFFPRMAVYNDVEGWQNHQFWGDGEFALPFGDYQVAITVPADHVLDATGELQNRGEVFSKEMIKRYEQARKSYDKPVLIVTQEEAEAAEKGFSNKTKTWKFKAENVRDFAFASSRKFIWDMQAVKIGGKDVMAGSLYPKEGNPLWGEYSTKVVAHTLKSYSEHTFDYPYPKAVSVHAMNQGMEYPMICWNHGRPAEDGTVSDQVKFGMISVIIHEVGHNFFPMVVNSDERQWGWMDEGFNTFLQYLAEQRFGRENPEAIAPGTSFPSRRGEPADIVRYMKGDPGNMVPIMSNPENVKQLGSNAYGKTSVALNILRETVMGPELFDHAFSTYAKRWKFKHPTPEDFFRTMEDASAVDLDWYWRSWFYSTDHVDLGIKEVKEFQVSEGPTEQMRKVLASRNMTEDDLPPLVYLAEEGSADYNPQLRGKAPSETSRNLGDFIREHGTGEEGEPRYFYRVTFEKLGGIPMPIIAEFTYGDGSKETVTYPPEIWRKNDSEVSRVVATQKEVMGIVLDPGQRTADVDQGNNSWSKSGDK